MENQHDNRQNKQDTDDADAIEKERRRRHRRTTESQGYAYIEMVGWMDRRERVRRNNDPFRF